MIFITGDTHGDIIRRLAVGTFPEQKEYEMTKNDYVIVCGDFGLIWDQELSKIEQYDIGWLEDKPWTTLFVDGNHENHTRLDDMKVSEWHGGLVHQISPSVIHLMRGGIFDIEGFSFFTFGGARSHDIDNLFDPEKDPLWKKKAKRLSKQFENYRVVGKSWWEREEASEEEFSRGIANLDKVDWKCDFVISHTCPASILTMYNSEFVVDRTSLYLEQIKEKLDYKHWFFGHLHDEKNITDKDHLIYKQIVRIS